jgi:putative ATPase
MQRQQFYRPVERGFEREIRKRLEYWARLRQMRASSNEQGAREEDDSSR